MPAYSRPLAPALWLLWRHIQWQDPPPCVKKNSGLILNFLQYHESHLSPRKCNPSGSYLPYYIRLSLHPESPSGPETEGESVVTSDDTKEPKSLGTGQRFDFGVGFEFILHGRTIDEFHGKYRDAFQIPDITRWKRIISAIERREGPIRQVQRFASDEHFIRYPDCYYHQAFSRRPDNVHQIDRERITHYRTHYQQPADFYREMLDPFSLAYFILTTEVLLSLILALPAAYGGIHLAVANFGFPSAPESLCWRISSIYTIVALPGIMLWSFVLGILFQRLVWKHLNGGEVKFVRFLLNLPSWTLLIGYIVARTYLVVESFASVRAEPIGVFWTPAWLHMIPHI